MSVISLRVCAAALGLCMISVTALGGDLTPPAGAVAPTGKTLTEVEPRTVINSLNTPGDANALFVINQAGSYYLDDNISVALFSGSFDVIRVDAPDVTIDLNGFRIVNLQGARHGIVASQGVDNTNVLNGTITGMGATGIELNDNALLRGVNVIGSTGNQALGAELGQDARVEGCSFVGNDSNGLLVFEGSVVTDSIARENTGVGFDTRGATVENCFAIENGTLGFRLSTGSMRACVARGNGVLGFDVFGAAVENSRAFDNGQGSEILDGGFSANDSVLRGCIAQENNGVGFRTNGQLKAEQCVAIGNTAEGFLAEQRAEFIACRAEENVSHGFNTGFQSVVRDSVAISNGIESEQDAGFRIGSSNRATGNVSVSNRVGFFVAGNSSLLTGNAASSNTSTNWIVLGGLNAVHVVNATQSGGFTGNEGGQPVASDPLVNFTY